MSNLINTKLFERAAEMVDYWQGTIIARTLEEDLRQNDLRVLESHVSEAEATASQQEFETRDVH